MAGEHSWAFEWTSTGAETERTPAAPAQTPREVRPGDVFAGYEILGVLGEGGMGSVFRARDVEASREVALKVLHEKASPSHLERLRREGELTAGLDHPGIVRVHAGGDVEGRPYLAYALVENARPLDHAWVDMDRSARVELLRITAEAVGHAHAHGVVHRDLKGDNILVDEDGAPSVVDFGLARHQEQSRLTQSGAIMGTPLAMAPEQFAAEHDRIGPATDVFALGVLLYQALTDELPFQGRGWLELATAVSEGRVTAPRALDPSIPAPLEAVCLRCLAVDPDDRYSDARVLAQDLDAALSGRPISSASAWLRMRRRSRWAIPLAFLAVVIVSALAGGTFSIRARSELRGRASELRRATQALERDGDERARRTLGRLLAKSSDLPADSRAAALLALAGGDAGTLEAWEERLELARRAAAIAPTPASRVSEGKCLLALERHGAAAEAFAAALRAAPAPETRLLLARAHLQGGAPADALAALEGAEVDAAWPWRARALLALGEGDEARALAAAYAERHQGVEGEVLLAELEQDHGDVDGLLRHIIRAYPRAPEPRRALAEHYLRLGSMGLAASPLEGLKEMNSARQFVSMADVDRAQAIGAAGTAPGWRRPVVGALLLSAERELAYRDVAWLNKRRPVYQERAASLLSLARELAETEWGPERVTLQALESRLGMGSSIPIPPPALLQEAKAEFGRVHELQLSRAKNPRELAELYRALYRRYPFFHRARYYYGKALAVAGEAEGMHEVLQAIRGDQALHSSLHADTFKRRANTQKFLPGGNRVRTVDERLEGMDRLSVGFVHSVSLEQEGREASAVPALVALDQVLQEEPGNVFARTLRGFVLTRLGRLKRAEEDLDLSAHAQPGCAMTAFYRFLLLAAQGRPALELREAMVHADRLGFNTWGHQTWNAEIYPEIAHVRGEAGFELLRGGPRSRRGR